jgi:hypothetical protein
LRDSGITDTAKLGAVYLYTTQDDSGFTEANSRTLTRDLGYINRSTGRRILNQLIESGLIEEASRGKGVQIRRGYNFRLTKKGVARW